VAKINGIKNFKKENIKFETEQSEENQLATQGMEGD